MDTLHLLVRNPYNRVFSLYSNVYFDILLVRILSNQSLRGILYTSLRKLIRQQCFVVTLLSTLARHVWPWHLSSITLQWKIDVDVPRFAQFSHGKLRAQLLCRHSDCPEILRSIYVDWNIRWSTPMSRCMLSVFILLHCWQQNVF